MPLAYLEKQLFELKNTSEFEELALKVFHFQYKNNSFYRDFSKALHRSPGSVTQLRDIPFLPIKFFKTQKITSSSTPPKTIFTSSGTTGSTPSKHYIPSLQLYEKTFFSAFESFYGPIEDYLVIGLLPSYLERKGSSLVYMVNAFIQKSRYPKSGFYLNNYQELTKNLKIWDTKGHKILLIGVSFALLDLIQQEEFHLKNTIVMETGGMKGRRKEMTRAELHQELQKGFGVRHIHSEYGMTELLSQAYSKGEGRFYCPQTLQVLIREPQDALSYQPDGKTGGLNIADLANLYSCAFIATQDLGKKYGHQEFEVLGRFDNSDVRGCNLMVL